MDPGASSSVNAPDPHDIQQVIQYAYTRLKSESAADRSEALRFLFNYDKPNIDSMPIIKQEGNGSLLFCGQLSHCITEKMFDYFQAGNFCFDDSKDAFLPRLRLVLGRTTVPTSKEYMYMNIPANLLKDITDKETATAFQQAIDRAVKKVQEKEPVQESSTSSQTTGKLKINDVWVDVKDDVDIESTGSIHVEGCGSSIPGDLTLRSTGGSITMVGVKARSLNTLVCSSDMTQEQLNAVSFLLSK